MANTVIHNYIKRCQVLYHPERFQGWGKKRNYFEGWYFKLISRDGGIKLAVIPGIALDEKGNGHSFIQVLDGIRKTSTYHKFPIKAFLVKHDDFCVSIKNNSFSERCISLNLENLKGEVKMDKGVPWPVRWWSPGIMGPYAFVPHMECYHGIVSMDNDLSGAVLFNGEEVDFDNGKGYIEKDWGSSFPSGYFWMQSNHFSIERASFKCSVAKIPWLGSAFVGFIAGLWIDGKLYQFTTYNRSRLVHSSANQNFVSIEIENKNFNLRIKAERSESTELASPILGAMSGKIEESMTASVRVILTRRSDGFEIFNDNGIHAGLEVAGKVDEITIK